MKTALTVLLVTTLVGGGAWFTFRSELSSMLKEMEFAHLESSTRDNIEELREDSSAIEGRRFELVALAEEQRLVAADLDTRRSKLDGAARQLARAASAAQRKSPLPSVQVASRPHALQRTGGQGAVRWGERFLTQDQARNTVVEWGKEVALLSQRHDEAMSKVAAYEAAGRELAAQRYELETAIGALELELETLLSDRDVMQTRIRIAEIVTERPALGRDDESAGHLRAIAEENRCLQARLNAFDRLEVETVSPNPERTLEDREILEHYGLAPASR